MFEKLFSRKAKGIGKNTPIEYNVLVEHFRGGKRVDTDTREIHNYVTNTGRADMAGLFNGTITTPYTWLAIGIGTAAGGTGDTTLTSEVTTSGGARQQSTGANVSRVTTSQTNDTAQLVTLWNFTGAFAVTESAVFASSAGGNMGARQTFSVVNVASGDSLQVTWKVQFS